MRIVMMPDPNERKIGFENLPNVYFKNIRIRNTNTDTQEITVSGHVRVFDGLEDKYWSDDEYLGSGQLRVRLVAFRKESRTSSVGVQVGDEHFVYGPLEGNKPIPFLIKVPKDQTQSLYISANLEMDLSSFENVDFNWTNNKWYRGPSTEELIYSGNSRVLAMFRLLKGGFLRSEPYYGPVHVHTQVPGTATEIGQQVASESTIMEGSFRLDPTTGLPRG